MADRDTSLPGPADFPPTAWSRLIAGKDSPAALDYLAQNYWKPAYLYVRRRWKKANEDAKDLTQEFFADLLARGWLDKASPQRGSFRKFLKTSLENFLRNEHRDAKAQKRGGGRAVVSLDALADEGVLLAREGDPEALFDREYLEAVFERCLPKLKAGYETEGKTVYFDVFRAYELERPADGSLTYEDLGARLGVSASDVRNYLHHVRERWKKLVREELRETTAGPAEFEAEVKELFPG